MIRAVRAALIFLAIAPLVVACGSETLRPEPPSDVAYLEDVSGGDDASIDGRLSITDGCLRFEANNQLFVPIFPDRGIAWDGDNLKVGDREFPLDVDITLGGGGYEGTKPQGATIPPGCAMVENFWVVNLD